MVEIYNYDVHDRYAKDQELVESFVKQYQLPPSRAGVVAIQTKVLDFIPKHSAIALLMQTHQKKTWAGFEPPPNFYMQRFSSSYVAPSLGSYEKQDADIHKVESFLKSRVEEQSVFEQGESIIQLLDFGIKRTNQEIDYIFSRIHQFVQA